MCLTTNRSRYLMFCFLPSTILFFRFFSMWVDRTIWILVFQKKKGKKIPTPKTESHWTQSK